MLFTPYSQTSSRLSQLGSFLPSSPSLRLLRSFAAISLSVPIREIRGFCVFCGFRGQFLIPHSSFLIGANGASVPFPLDALFLAPIVFMNNFTEQHGESTTKEETRQSKTDTENIRCHNRL